MGSRRLLVVIKRVGNMAMHWFTLALILLSHQAYANGQCSEDFIKKTVDNGNIVMRSSGAVFEVMSGDNIDSMLWVPASNLLICSSVVPYQGKNYEVWTLINTDEGGKVSAFKLK